MTTRRSKRLRSIGPDGTKAPGSVLSTQFPSEGHDLSHELSSVFQGGVEDATLIVVTLHVAGLDWKTNRYQPVPAEVLNVGRARFSGSSIILDKLVKMKLIEMNSEQSWCLTTLAEKFMPYWALEALPETFIVKNALASFAGDQFAQLALTLDKASRGKNDDNSDDDDDDDDGNDVRFRSLSELGKWVVLRGLPLRISIGQRDVVFRDLLEPSVIAWLGWAKTAQLTARGLVSTRARHQMDVDMAIAVNALAKANYVARHYHERDGFYPEVIKRMAPWPELHHLFTTNNGFYPPVPEVVTYHWVYVGGRCGKKFDRVRHVHRSSFMAMTPEVTAEALATLFCPKLATLSQVKGVLTHHSGGELVVTSKALYNDVGGKVANGGFGTKLRWDAWPVILRDSTGIGINVVTGNHSPPLESLPLVFYGALKSGLVVRVQRDHHSASTAVWEHLRVSHPLGTGFDGVERSGTVVREGDWSSDDLKDLAVSGIGTDWADESQAEGNSTLAEWENTNALTIAPGWLTFTEAWDRFPEMDVVDDETK